MLYEVITDFIGFPNVGRAYLENPKLPALVSSRFSRRRNAFHAISEGDILRNNFV